MGDRTHDEDLHEAIARSRGALWAAQRSDGSWDERSDVGPASTANVLVALHHVGLLPRDDLRRGAAWLRSKQLRDGSFRPYPYARHGNLSTTAQCWAALSLGDAPEDRAAAAKAQAYVMSHGGLDLVVDEMRTGDVAAIFLALAGLLEPERLPAPPLTWAFFDTVVDELAKRFHFGIITGALQLSMISHALRGDFEWRSPYQKRLGRRVVELMSVFQNRDGSWNSNTVQTAIAVPALVAAGLPTDHDRVQRAAKWLLSRRVEDPRGVWFDVFSSNIWSTAFTVRALMLSGTGADDPRVVRAVEWLLDAQLDVPMPRYNQRREGALRTGGWPFQTGNETMADCDDGGIVLSVFGLAMKDGGLPEATQRRITASVRRARQWLAGMQNPDGGWSAFVWSLPGHHPDRTLYDKPIDLPPDSIAKAFRALAHPPAELGDPSTEDLTARVLHGLGSMGATTQDPLVANGVAFLRDRQTEHGAWWGRWVCNYLASTAYVLGALARVGEDPREAYVERAIAWTLKNQNSDGGWGEVTESYSDPSRAGRGPSTAPLTALVVQGLTEIGEGDRPAVRRAVDYLVRRQRADGTWPNDDYVATNIPPAGFYVYDGAARHMPLEALARFAHRHAPTPPAPMPHLGRWTSDVLDPMRQQIDPVADAVVHAIYGADHAGAGDVSKVNDLLAKIFENDDPIPADLPDEAKAFFAETSALPDWAEPAKIERAQEIFADFGVYVTFGLFCSSLPQSYCAAHGAQVLTKTGAMLDRVRQRIFETAQFLFDVLDEGSLDPDGRGVRSAQRVRLMHAAVRCLIRHRVGSDWDAAQLGEPINQEDLAGTLMTFSVVTYEAARRLGVDLDETDGDAWVHHWTVVGHLMGIRPELLPTSLRDGQRLMAAIRERQWAPSEQGQQLAAALIGLMQELFTRDVDAFDGLTPTLIRYLAGDRCADLLGVAESDWTELVVRAFELATDVIDVDDRETWLEKQLGEIAGLTMRWITEVERGHKSASFRIPASLRETVVPNT